MINQLFALLRLGLRLSETNDESLELFTDFAPKKWGELWNLAYKQGVAAIVLDGVERLKEQDSQPTKTLSQEYLLEWIGEVMMIEQANQQQLSVMNDLADKWIQDGCRVMVFKGQANGILYPKPEHRSPGDIDCYLFTDYAKGNELARKAGATVDEGWYKHSQIAYKGETFENHQYFVHTREGKRSKLLQKELENALQIAEWQSFPQSDILLPPVQWNAMFLTYHACAHFLSEGLRLKQVLDWAMFLKCDQEQVDWETYYAFCERHHLRRFADTLTAICVKYLGVRIYITEITTDITFTERIFNSILYDDDYIYSEGECGWNERWHVVKNLFRYRWKYDEICELSVWKQLWWYATGYLLHTEI